MCVIRFEFFVFKVKFLFLLLLSLDMGGFEFGGFNRLNNLELDS